MAKSAADKAALIPEEVNEKPKRKSRIALIIIGLVTLVQCGVLLVIFKEPLIEFFQSLSIEKEEELVLQYYEVGNLSVNLADEGHFLKTTIQLGYYHAEDGELLIASEIDVKALILEILRSKSFDEVNSVSKTKEIELELLEGLNALFEKELISKIYFVEYLYQ